MSPLTVWLLASFASWRLAHLVARDSFPPTVALRKRAIRRGPSSFWALLVTCPLCVSAYTSAAIVGAMAVGYDVPAPVLVWLASWGGASFIALAVE